MSGPSMIRDLASAVVEAVRVRIPEAGRDYLPLGPRPTVGIGVPLRDPQSPPDSPRRIVGTPEERARWARGEDVCSRAFGQGPDDGAAK